MVVKKCSMTKKFLHILIFFITSALLYCNSAFAFFTENHRRNLQYGIFKNTYSADIYFNVIAGFIVKTWTPTFTTILSPDKDLLATYANEIPSQISQKTSNMYTFSVEINLGLRTLYSHIRHEIGLKWYRIGSNDMELTNDEHRSYSINGTAYNYVSLQGKAVHTAGLYADVYHLMYSVYYDFEKAFSLFRTKWDVYIGLGAGFAFIKGGIYAGQVIARSQTETIDNDGNAHAATNYALNENNTSITKLADSKLNSTTALGVGFQVTLGVLANLSQSFAANVSISFEGTSRPLLTNHFKAISKVDGVNALLEYHVALKIGIFLKAFEMAM